MRDESAGAALVVGVEDLARAEGRGRRVPLDQQHAHVRGVVCCRIVAAKHVVVAAGSGAVVAAARLVGAALLIKVR